MDDDNDDDDDGDEDDDDTKATNGAKELDEDLENSIFMKLGQAQPIPPSEIPDFEERFEPQFKKILTLEDISLKEKDC